ncbi:tetratricopeptide repeat protein [Bacteroidota bacterium]
MIQFRIKPEIILQLLIVWIGYPCLAQKEIPQNPNRYETDKSKKGNWTVLYNEDGIETNDPSSTAYYRLITYKKGIIEGQVVDHYKSGVKKWEGYLTSDDPDSLTGINKWYDTDGNLICILHFDNDKLQLSISEALHPNRSNKNLTFENSLEFYADLLAKKKRYNEAISIYQILISAIQKTGAKPIDMARIFQSTGSSWLFIDEYINALTNFQLASQVTDREEDLVPAYLKSGECLIKLGQYDSAHFYLNKSIELQKSFKTTETDTYAQTLDQSGLAYYNLKDYNPAINNFKKALGILKSGQKQISEEYIIMLHHAALSYAESGSSAAAVKAQKLGVTIAGKVYEKGSAEIAYVQMQMAKIYLNCSQPGMALKEALPALRVLKRNKDSYTKLYVGGLIITGEIYENLKQEKLVEYYYNLALKTIDEYRGSYNIDYTQLLARLADLQFDSGRFECQVFVRSVRM